MKRSDKRISRAVNSEILLGNIDGATMKIIIKSLLGRGGRTMCYQGELYLDNIPKCCVVLKDYHPLNTEMPFDNVNDSEDYQKWVSDNNNVYLKPKNYFLESEKICDNLNKVFYISRDRVGLNLGDWIRENCKSDDYPLQFLKIFDKLLLQLGLFQGTLQDDTVPDFIKNIRRLHFDIKEDNIFVINDATDILPRFIDFGSSLEWQNNDIPKDEKLYYRPSTFGYIKFCDLDDGFCDSYFNLSGDKKREYIYAIDLYAMAQILDNAFKNIECKDDFIKNRIDKVIEKGKSVISERYHSCDEMREDIEAVINLFEKTQITPLLVQYENIQYIEKANFDAELIGGVQLDKLSKYYHHEEEIDDALMPLDVDDDRRMFIERIKDFLQDKNDNIIYLYGDGGAGKSTLLHKLFLDYLKVDEPDGYMFYISAKSTNSATERPILSFISNDIIKPANNRLDCETIINSKNVTILLDGINETDDDRKLLQEIKTYDKAKIVITGRAQEIDGCKCCNNQIPALTAKQIEKYLDNFFKDKPEIEISKNKILDLGRPFLLILFCQTYKISFKSKLLDYNPKKPYHLEYDLTTYYKSINEIELIDGYFSACIEDYNSNTKLLQSEKNEYNDFSDFEQIVLDIEKYVYEKEIEHKIPKISELIRRNIPILKRFGNTMFVINGKKSNELSIKFTHDLFRDYFIARYVLREVVNNRNVEIKQRNYISLVKVLPYVAKYYDVLRLKDDGYIDFEVKKYTDDILSYRGFYIYLLGLYIYSNHEFEEPVVCNDDENERALLKFLYSGESCDLLFNYQNIMSVVSNALNIVNVELWSIPCYIKKLTFSFGHDWLLKKLILTDGLEEIGYNICFGLENLYEVVIPKTVTTIGLHSFFACRNLAKIIVKEGNKNYYSSGNCLIDKKTGKLILGCKNSIIPKNVKLIGHGAFINCVNLQKIKIPDSVTRIESEAFEYCYNLVDVELSDSLTYIGSKAFNECYNLKQINIPGGVEIIKDFTFHGCHNIQNVRISNGVQSIEFHAFYECSNLNSVFLPASIFMIDCLAFEKCDNLINIKIDRNNLSYYSKNNCIIELSNKELILGCNSSIIPSDGSVISIGDYAFTECSGLKSIEIPDSVTNIGNSAFYGCSGLKSITIGNGVTSIGSSAFEGCSNLTNINIPNSVRSIRNYTFYGCSGLKSIEIPDSVTNIGNSAFYGCSGLKSVTIGNGVASIGSSAFEGCRRLIKVILADSVKEIGDYAFYNCTDLYNINMTGTEISIGKNAFGCDAKPIPPRLSGSRYII